MITWPARIQLECCRKDSLLRGRRDGSWRLCIVTETASHLFLILHLTISSMKLQATKIGLVGIKSSVIASTQMVHQISKAIYPHQKGSCRVNICVASSTSQQYRQGANAAPKATLYSKAYADRPNCQPRCPARPRMHTMGRNHSGSVCHTQCKCRTQLQHNHT